MITFIDGNIANVKADVIVNASNGIGYMGGLIGRFIKLKGVAESIHYVDHSIEKEAKRICRKNLIKPGDVFVTNSGQLPCNYIFHAVTMFLPGTWSSIKSIETCILNIIKLGEEYKVETIAIPYLGCGTGSLKKEQLNNLYEFYFKKHDSITFMIIDWSRK
ncbi:macro domain-containing protein [Niallia sp. MER 6]|uniref:macro domain-containing protein n=1 Tax=Niallia sp. MER 6 TaxID=2939567 RepID=UPI00203DAB73|nr:macro domain-containing protein [Niallia sp. MER 6]MCM3032876.1 macro domain-containing protein [Niallia sp. MER 6]